MATAEERIAVRWEHPDSGWLMPFPTEAEAVDYCVRRLAPYCSKIVREPPIGDGLRPDLGIRVKGIDEIPLAIECKAFSEHDASAFATAVPQASSYARRLEWAAFVAPLAGKGASKFDWQASRLGLALLIAGQFSVGGLYFNHERYRDRPAGGLLLAGVQIAHFSLNESGEPEVRVNSNARHLLKVKQRHGSASWRQ